MDTEPDEFNAVFRQGVPIVGGHAVNIWARYYSERNPTLAVFGPFTSKDGDIFLRDRDLAKAIAAAAGWSFRNNPDPRSTMIGHIFMNRGEEELRVDVLRSVNGVNDKELATTTELRFKEGVTYALPEPWVMLKAKIGNLATIEQEPTDRDDRRHVLIMVECCREYVKDMCAAAAASTATERAAVNLLMDTLHVVESAQGMAMDEKHDLRLRRAIPPAPEIAEIAQLPKVAAFYAHQMR